MTDTDFPRVFFLMHKWFMESGDLANMLVDLYEKFEKEASDTNKPIALKINAIESQTQINHAIQLVYAKYFKKKSLFIFFKILD